jgi:hypothetical protein
MGGTPGCNAAGVVAMEDPSHPHIYKIKIRGGVKTNPQKYPGKC